MPKLHNQLAGNSVERIAGLSDGVFAIAVTLILLEIRLPEHLAVTTDGELPAALGRLGPRFLMYAMSFMTAGIFRVGQPTELNQLERADRGLVRRVHLLEHRLHRRRAAQPCRGPALLDPAQALKRASGRA